MVEFIDLAYGKKRSFKDFISFIKKAGSIAVVGAVFAGGIVGGIFIRNQYSTPSGGVTTTVQQPPSGGSTVWDTANLWVNTSAAGSCVHHALAAYDAANHCGSMQAAMTAAQAGDRIVMKCGTYVSQTISSGTKASVVNFYAENYDQATTPYTVLGSTSCVYVAGLSLNGVDRIHIWGVQATKGPWQGTRSDNAVLQYQSGGSLDICGSGCTGFTTQDILVDGFHGKQAFLRATNVVIDHSAFGGYDVCYDPNQVHIIAINLPGGNAGNWEDAFRFWDGTGGTPTPTNDTLRNSVLHDLIMDTNNAHESDQCGIGSQYGPHSDCMQNNGGINITIASNIFVDCSSSDIQWNPFGSNTIGAQLIENNVFGPLTGGAVNGTVLGAQGSGWNCSGIVVRNNLYWASQNINPGGSPGGCTGGAMQVYGNVFRSSSCTGTGNTVIYTHNVYLSGSCGTTPKTCTPTWAAGSAPTTSEDWSNTVPNYNIANSDTCTADYASTSYPTTDILGNSRPIGPGADAGANEIGPTVYTTNQIFQGGDTDRTSHTFTFTGSAPVGSTVAICSTYSVDNETTVGLTDSQGNIWNKVYKQDQTDVSANFSQDFWYSTITHAISPGNTFTMPADPIILPIGNTLWVEAYDITTSPSRVLQLDQFAAGLTGYSNTHTSPSITTTAADEIMLGCHSAQSITGTWWTAGANWTKLAEYNANLTQIRDVAIQKRVVTATGTYNSTGTTPGSAYGVDSIVSFK